MVQFLMGLILTIHIYAFVNFKNASLRNTSFDGSDWFNAMGLTIEQLANVKISTFRMAPQNSDGLIQYMDHYYTYSYHDLIPEARRELDKIWSEYYKKNGLVNYINQKNNYSYK